MRIVILWVGKTRNEPISVLCSDYLERLKHFGPCVLLETRDASRSRKRPIAEVLRSEAAEIRKRLAPGSRIVTLDPGGREFTSEDLAAWLKRRQDNGERELSFVIGGPNGLDRSLVDRSDLRLSLGRMTWTHEMSRLLLLEQIYRAFCINKNLPYHK